VFLVEEFGLREAGWQAIDLGTKICERNKDAEMCMQVASMLHGGRVMSRNTDRALELSSRACALGHSDPEIAASLLSRGCEMGQSSCCERQSSLGSIAENDE